MDVEYTYSGQLAIFNFLIWLILIIRYKAGFGSQTRFSFHYAFLCIMIVLFATFGFSEADTYHYHSIYDEMIKFRSAIHVEPIYYWLIEHIPHNYYLWRFVIWGSAAVLLMATFKRLRLNALAVGLAFPLILLQQFAITRGCLGISIFLYASTFILKPDSNKLYSYCWGILCCVLSVFFHKSIPLFIAMSFLALIPLNRGLIIISIILYPILRAVAMPFVFDILGGSLFSTETAEFAQGYLESDKSIANINGIMRLCLEYIPRILIFIFLVKEYIFSKKEIPKSIRFFFQYSYILFYIAMLFFGQDTSSFVSSRTIHMMCFPLTIVCAYYLTTSEKRPILLKSALSFFILYDAFAFLYTIYKYW